ncbi:hypothetical protein DLH72_04310 [Candidatus Gracilibacteria bacterium]|nr:MAG: hypothetical protein DLH72_04310 [Candidatus Gracilibacteria bacterium]
MNYIYTLKIFFKIIFSLFFAFIFFLVPTAGLKSNIYEVTLENGEVFNLYIFSILGLFGTNPIQLGFNGGNNYNLDFLSFWDIFLFSPFQIFIIFVNIFSYFSIFLLVFFTEIKKLFGLKIFKNCIFDKISHIFIVLFIFLLFIKFVNIVFSLAFLGNLDYVF